jgi:hypothetical protein
MEVSLLFPRVRFVYQKNEWDHSGYRFAEKHLFERQEAIGSDPVWPLGPFTQTVTVKLMFSHTNSSVLNRLTNKTTPLSSVVSNHAFYYPTPSNLSYS